MNKSSFPRDAAGVPASAEVRKRRSRRAVPCCRYTRGLTALLAHTGAMPAGKSTAQLAPASCTTPAAGSLWQEFFGSLFTKWRKSSEAQAAHLYAHLVCCFRRRYLRAISEEHREEMACSLYCSFPFSLTTVILLHYFYFLGFEFFHTVSFLTFPQKTWNYFMLRLSNWICLNIDMESRRRSWISSRQERVILASRSLYLYV